MKLEEIAKLLFCLVRFSFSSCKVFNLPSLGGDLSVKTVPRFPQQQRIFKGSVTQTGNWIDGF